MFEVFDQIGAFLKMLWDFILMILNGLVMMFTVIPKGMSFLIGTIPYIPSLLAPFVMITITVSIIFFILGRRVD